MVRWFAQDACAKFQSQTTPAKECGRFSLFGLSVKSVLVVFLLSLMSVGCIEESRTLRRRVQMGSMRTPPIVLPAGQGNFDFQAVVNSQTYDILRRSKAFSTATIDPNKPFDPSGLEEWDSKSFNSCPQPMESAAMASGQGAISESAICMIDQPQGVVSGDLNNFQLIAHGGATLSMLDVSIMPQSTFEFKSYELSMSLRVMDPQIAGQNIAATSSESYSSDIGVNATINFAQFTAGSKIYYNSPLRKVVDEALTSAISELKAQWDEASPWFTTVIRHCDKTIFVNGGNKTDAGLMVGDLVRVHNVLYRWTGPVCHSRLMGSAVSERAIGWAKITSVGDTMSVAQLIDDDPKYPLMEKRSIKPGARIYIEKFRPVR